MPTQDVCRVLFWNVNRKKFPSLVSKLVTSTQADVVVLNESGMKPSALLKKLKTEVSETFCLPDFDNSDSRFHCFGKDQSLFLEEIHCGARTSIRVLNLGETSILLVLVHGADVRNYDIEARQSIMQRLMDEVAWVKEKEQHNRIIIIGDFNMNPFDKPMNLAMGFNAMMTKTCIRLGTRTFNEEKFDFYYNPMWSFFGDRIDGPSGTTYNTSSQGMYGWSMFDQVLICHSIVDRFQKVEILTHAGDESLVTSLGRPDSEKSSDHLPILIELKRG